MLRIILTSLFLIILPGGALAQTPEKIVIDGSAPEHAFPHFGSRCSAPAAPF